MTTLRRFTVRLPDRSVDVEVRAGLDATADAVLTAVRLAGDVVDQDGKPVDRRAPATTLRNGAIYGPPTAVEGLAAELELRVVAGVASGLAVVPPAGGFTIGRSERAEVTIADQTVSSRHATAAVEGDRVVVKDLGSTNGTFVAGVEASEPREVAAGEVVRFGDAVAVLHRRATPDGVVRVEPSGRALFNVTPRQLDRVSAVEATVPAAPAEPDAVSLGANAGMAGVTAVGGVGLALLTGRYEMLAFAAMSPVQFLATGTMQRRRAARKHRQVVAEHAAAIAGAKQRTDEAMAAERRHLEQSLPNPAELEDVATGPTSRLWERQPAADDFLRLRVGVGARPSTLAMVSAAGRTEAPMLVDVPVDVSLGADRVLGLHGPADHVRGLARWVVAQLAALHSPRRLRLAVLAPNASASDWDWVKWLPHVREEAGFSVGSDADSAVAILEALVAHIDEAVAEPGFGLRDLPQPSLVVVLDDDGALAHHPLLTRVLEEGPAAGIAVVCTAATRQELPAACTATIGVDPICRLEVHGTGSPRWTDPVAELLPVERAERIARGMSWLEPSGAAAGRATELPYPLTFGDLIDDDPGGDAAITGWSGDGTSTTFRFGAVAGGDATLDLVADGPHFLVSGTAGSGKSELVQSMLAGLAVANRPDRLNFALFDFKGGACFGAGLDLPHTTAVTVNLDGAEGILRAVRLLRAELDWRERQFAAADKAQSLAEYWQRRSGTLPHMARLVVVIDEFARFVDALPGVIDTFIDIGRIGRSLGVHLILATQSPRSCVTGDLRSNVQTTVALRTANEIESNLVIGADDAARISADHRGRGVLNSPRAPLTLFQSAWVGAPLASAAADDAPVAVRELAWDTLHLRAAPPTTPVTGRKEFDLLAERQRQAWAELDGPPLRVPLPPDLPTTLGPVDDPDGEPALVAIGREDRVGAQDQPVFAVDLLAGRHVLVAGSGGTGRTTALRSIALAGAHRLGPAELELHVVDLASTRLASLEQLPHAGTVLLAGDDYLVGPFLSRLAGELAERERQLQQARADRLADLPGGRPPVIVLLVDNWGSLGRLLERDPELRALWEGLLDKGRSTGLTVVAAGDETTGVREVVARFEEKLILSFVDPNAYLRYGIDDRGAPADLRPGRAVRTRTGNRVQLAQYPAGAESATPGGGSRALRLRRLPFPVGRTSLPAAGGGPMVVPLGLGGPDASVVALDLDEHGPALLVAGPTKSGRTTALATITRGLVERDVRVVVSAGRRSPLRSLVADGVMVVDGRLSDLTGTLDDGVPTVLVADDAGADVLDDAGLAWFLGAAGRAAVVALRWNDARNLRTGQPLASALRRSPTALLLQPVPGSAVPSVGLEVPRQLSLPAVPGRGWLAVDGELVDIQVAQ